jgi:hypothetical protein
LVYQILNVKVLLKLKFPHHLFKNVGELSPLR